jgi:thioesterase domain-containing protein
MQDDFFQLGGHSLNVLRLSARFEAVWGQKLPVAAVFAARTLAKLAELLSRQAPTSAEPSSLVVLQEGSSPRPLVLMPSLGGSAFCCHTLVQHLPAELPVYSLEIDRPADWSGHESLETMAAECVAAIQSAGLRPPFQLAGYSFGGMLAYEAARQLAARGDGVAFVGIIDTGPGCCQSPSVGTIASSALRFAKNLPAWVRFTCTYDGYRDFRARLKRRLIASMRRLRWTASTRSFGRLSWELEDIWDADVIPLQRREVWQAHLRAFAAYNPAPYDGPVTLFQAAVRPLFHSLDPHLGWSRIVRGGVEVRRVPGNHALMLRGAACRTLAGEMRDALARAGAARR